MTSQDTKIHCNQCDSMKPTSEFTKDRTNKRGYQYSCKACAAEYKRKNKDRRRDADYQRMYGITLEQYDIMRKEQDSCCKLCRTHESAQPHGRLVVDHCHATGAVRGLLCNNCNTALGLLRDDTSLLRACINYLGDNI
jgi:hypothetical protein